MTNGNRGSIISLIKLFPMGNNQQNLNQEQRAQINNLQEVLAKEAQSNDVYSNHSMSMSMEDEEWQKPLEKAPSCIFENNGNENSMLMFDH